MPFPTPFSPWLGIFETLRVEKGRPLFVREHEQNLKLAAAALDLTISENLIARAARLPQETGRWRWIVTPEKTDDSFQKEDSPLPAHYKLVISQNRVGSQNWDARFKTFSYLTHAQARKAAKAQGADEAVLLNENGALASGAMTNLFWKKGDQFFTPHLDAGCRGGVVRNWILEKISIDQGTYPVEELQEADEIFVTNSMIGIMPVSQLDAKILLTGKQTRELQALYQKRSIEEL